MFPFNAVAWWEGSCMACLLHADSFHPKSKMQSKLTGAKLKLPRKKFRLPKATNSHRSRTDIASSCFVWTINLQHSRLGKCVHSISAISLSPLCSARRRREGSSPSSCTTPFPHWISTSTSARIGAQYCRRLGSGTPAARLEE